MSEQTDATNVPRTKPTDRAWLDAKRDVADRNDRARKAGKAERAAHDRQIADLRRADRANIER